MSNWISLKEAAKRLDVHPTTLRRWADKGEIRVTVTPGGHRRFDPAEVERFNNSQRVRRPDEVQSVWAKNAIQNSREGIVARPQASWLQTQDEQTRLQFRSLGQRLVGLAMQYMARQDEAEDILRQATEMGHEYADVSMATGMGLTDALRASMFFHGQLLESSLELPENARIRPETNRRIMRRINTLLNTIHLGIAARFEDRYPT
ncbi:MAG: MerR family transcriptional regulator [Candidatus Promineifilaceae bacterium]